ncbi:PREDICTED: protein cycle-like, partial [Polistes dominula]|uniref:Protein cycle-like n=1 Tax=Polistes dominula TaxID=743375 RepID=A0ABM1JBM9_POLDO
NGQLLLFQAAEGFVFVVGCDRGRILYVSESVSQTLNYSQVPNHDIRNKLTTMDKTKMRVIFEYDFRRGTNAVQESRNVNEVFGKDVANERTVFRRFKKFRSGDFDLQNEPRGWPESKADDDQLKAVVEANPSETTPGLAASLRISLDWKYCVIQCTGYLKSWAPAKIGLEEQEGETDGEACNLSCLVAVGRIQSVLPTPSTSPRRPRLRTIEFISRHAMDGKFLFVDQRATLVLGFLPQELLGTSMYEYYHHDDIPHLAESHKSALQSSERVTTQVYRFRNKSSNFVRLQSEWKSFKNPWTKDIEYLIAKNS